jgi:hypothetical protein
MKELSEII